ncbi:MAG: SUMF1/EgtB/PvdO family nonheme iron enzyme [Alteromonadaceae bacterium]|nr:SUMF1/EgtB/PvdO family nonheme iron enzyme [Alteromonadaceae bacterium]
MHYIKFTFQTLAFSTSLLFLLACSKPDIAMDAACNDFSSSYITFPAGQITFGQNALYPEERGIKTVQVPAFKLSVTEVTNGQFAEFVTETGYITRAERGIDAHLAPDLSAHFRQPGGLVFLPLVEQNSENITRLWEFIPGANWRHPYGPNSTITGKAHHPLHIGVIGTTHTFWYDPCDVLRGIFDIAGFTMNAILCIDL